MNQIKVRFTVLFEEPFWIGLYERESQGKYEVSKVTFGAEPKLYDIYSFLLKNQHKLRFSPAFKADIDKEHKNPKRLQRQAKKAVADSGIGTKAQQALKLQQAEGKRAAKKRSRAQKDAEAERQFILKQEKRKEKHRGH